ncbi:hypothetical protein E4L96_20030 [Massilia arenosa]|uniref:Uncharacterized protein n=1 Tax=Zemynaea arenosa TaxID=2561931 RepID=A0A4Y9RVR2_9BURK|nr:hypothetical protein [Massilia arenosa]TFW13387.1 hypothetical protein E4L96_20030 [Massilia arenosa]
MKPGIASALTAVAVTLPLVLLTYWHTVRQVRIGTVDLGAIVRAEESKFNAAATRPMSASERQALVDRARQAGEHFARELPRAIAEVQQECGCTLLDRSAVLQARPEVSDWTPNLRSKLGL